MSNTKTCLLGWTREGFERDFGDDYDFSRVTDEEWEDMADYIGQMLDIHLKNVDWTEMLELVIPHLRKGDAEDD